MSAFHDVRLPENISYGVIGGPVYSTTVQTTTSGHERRNMNWRHSLHRWDLAHAFRQVSPSEAERDIAVLIAFFHARRGRAHAFRFKDWIDFQASGQVLGTGDGTTDTFQLVKWYTDAGGSYRRPITKPVAGTVTVSLDGLDQPSGWSVNTTTGIVTFDTPPADGVQVAAAFEFDVPVRFDMDDMQVAVENYDMGEWRSIIVREVRA